MKGLIIQNTGLNPPRNHNLVMLAETAGLNLNNYQKQLLLEITDFNLEARYPDYKKSFYHLCTGEFAGKYFEEIKGLRTWLLSLRKQ